MGVATSAEVAAAKDRGVASRQLPAGDVFRRRVLLVNPSEAVVDWLLEEGEALGDASLDHVAVHDNYSVHTTRLLRTIEATVVVWSGHPLLSEQWLTVLGNHVLVLYFFDPARDAGVGATTESVASKMRRDLAEIVETSPGATVRVVQLLAASPEPAPGSAAAAAARARRREPRHHGALAHRPVEPPLRTAAVAAAMAAVTGTPDAAAAPPADTPDYALAARSNGYPLTPLDPSDPAAVFDMSCFLASFLVPSKLFAPLVALLNELVEACDADEAFLADSASFVPLVTTADLDLSDGFQHRTHSVCRVLGAWAKKIAAREKTDFHFVSLGLPEARVFLGWACRPHAYVVVVRSVRRETGGIHIGDKLVETNMGYFATHFANVVNNTTQTRDHKPIRE